MISNTFSPKDLAKNWRVWLRTHTVYIFKKLVLKNRHFSQKIDKIDQNSDHNIDPWTKQFTGTHVITELSKSKYYMYVCTLPWHLHTYVMLEIVFEAVQLTWIHAYSQIVMYIYVCKKNETDKKLFHVDILHTLRCNKAFVNNWQFSIFIFFICIEL
jgi:hypothetical protein